MIYLKILAALSFVGAVAWMVKDPGFEPVLAILGASATFIGLMLTDRKKTLEPTQNQTVSAGSLGIQAGGDVNIGDGRKKSDV
ncbi:hypothetical protein [Acidovorax sp.]|uniref:hypothetical protein n=1 Tax=Acidovorax sp. TaxID=1872122 RepID=UPI002ACE0A91|nr:hypothetical protein [Acidovorax sp.]MDZ7862433.1 hypothetical protein [Acidovorax sp.]